MRDFQEYITEGVYDPNIFKAFFLAGGPGSGKSWVSARTLSGMGLKVINSDDTFAAALKKENMSLNFAMSDPKEVERRDAIRTKAKALTVRILKKSMHSMILLYLVWTRSINVVLQKQDATKQIVSKD